MGNQTNNEASGIRIFVVLSIYLCVLFYSSGVFAQLSPDEIKSALIIHFCKNVYWPDPVEGDFVIGFLSEDKSVYNYMKESDDKLKINNRKVLLKQIRNTDEIRTCQALYYAQADQEDFPGIVSTAREHHVLVITDSHEDQLFVMINIMDIENKISFKVNMPNMTLAGFTLSPDLLLYGGSLVDIKTAYTQFEKTLEETQLKIESVNQAIKEKENSLKQKDSIIRLKEQELERYASRIKDYEKEITSYEKESEFLKIQVDKEKYMLQQKSSQVENNDFKLRQIFSDIEQKQHELSVYRKNISNMKNKSDSLLLEIENKNFAIGKQKAHISKQKKLIIIFWSLLLLFVVAVILSLKLVFTNKKLRENIEKFMSYSKKKDLQ